MKYQMLAVAVTVTVCGAALAQIKDWTFGDGTTPEAWGTINSDYAACDSGKMQSPINLAKADALGKLKLATNFGQAQGKLALGQEKVQIDFDAGQDKGMVSGEKAFGLLQLHFHTPAEHAVDGKRYPMVAHLVHATSAGELGVLGVFFTEGGANPALATILRAHKQGTGTALTLNIDELLPNDVEVYRYMGSLTTPPCSEGVNWHVANAPVEASAEQIAALSEALGPTARSLQARNGRLLVAPE